MQLQHIPNFVQRKADLSCQHFAVKKIHYSGRTVTSVIFESFSENNFTVDVLLNEKLPKSCQSLPSSSSNSSPATRGINTSPVSPSKSCVEWCFGDRDFEKRTAIFSESLSAFIMRSCAKPANSGGYSNDFVNVNDFTKEANAYLSRENSKFFP